MLAKLRMPNGGTVLVLAERIQGMEIGPTPTNGQPVTTVFLEGGESHPITYDQAQEVESYMLNLHPVAYSVSPATSATK